MNNRRDAASAAVAILMAGAVLASCSSPSPGVAAPAGLPRFYAVPPGLSAKVPGELLKWQAVPAPGLRGSAYRVMYVSRDAQGQPAAVTGIVFVPDVPIPPRGYPVLSWAHGTNGFADRCAPSLDPLSALPSVAALNAVLDLGWEFVASDYQGEGTPPGLLPFLVGEVAADDAIDIVRAVHGLTGAHASSTYVLWGYSEGGQAAIYAWHRGSNYGSRGGLHLAAVVAGAPPSHLVSSFERLENGPNRVYLLALEAGFNAAYGDRRAPLAAVLTSTGRRLVSDLGEGCLAHDASVIDSYPPAQVFKADPATVARWRSLLATNDPAAFTAAKAIPLLLVQGGSDTVVDPVGTDQLARGLCRSGQHLQEWLYPGQGHGSAFLVSAGDVARWIASQFAGESPGSYVPTGETGIVRTVCPS